MTTLHWLGLLALAVIAGAVVPFQSAINTNLGRGLGHPLWATLASLLVSIIVLLPVIVALRLPLPSLGFVSKAPLWMWAGVAFGVCFISLGIGCISVIAALYPLQMPGWVWGLLLSVRLRALRARLCSDSLIARR